MGRRGGTTAAPVLMQRGTIGCGAEGCHAAATGSETRSGAGSRLRRVRKLGPRRRRGRSSSGAVRRRREVSADGGQSVPSRRECGPATAAVTVRKPDGGQPASDGAATTSGSDGGPDGAAPGTSTTAVLTYHNDSARTGLYSVETTLTPSNVNASSFGKLFALAVDSYVYAQPLYVPGLPVGGGTHDVVFVVTEKNSVYAFDASTSGPALWHVNVGTALSCSDLNDCGDLVPGAGITGTPVIDPASRTMYLVALSKDSTGSHHRLHAIDLTSGADKLGGPVEIAPTASGTGANSTSGTVAFSPLDPLPADRAAPRRRRRLRRDRGERGVRLQQPRLDRGLQGERSHPDDDVLRVAGRQLELHLAVRRWALLGLRRIRLRRDGQRHVRRRHGRQGLRRQRAQARFHGKGR